MAKLALRIARALKTKAHQMTIHEFEPQGVSVVLMVSLSHLSIHTWPLDSEGRSVAIDVFSCDAKTKIGKKFVRDVVLPVTKGRIVSIQRFSRCLVSRMNVCPAW